MSKADDDTPDIVSNPDVGLPAGELEWLVTNGLGGYAAGTVRGVATRRYHGLLISAHAPPDGRRMMLNHLVDSLHLPDGKTAYLDSDRRVGRSPASGSGADTEFRLDHGLPVWLYRFGAVALERRVLMVRERNTTLVRYRLTEGGPLRFGVRPLIHFRPQHAAVGKFKGEPPYHITETDRGYEIVSREQPQRLRLRLVGAEWEFRHEPHVESEVLYRKEAERGYHDEGELWSPGTFEFELPAGRSPITLIASDEDWDEIVAVRPEDVLEAETGRRDDLLARAAPALRSGPAAPLVLAADHHVVMPMRASSGDATDVPRAVTAGYYWFSEWGRDTMISLEGLTLCTGRPDDARRILRHVAGDIRDGLIPDRVPETATEGSYDTADASLWFVHAAHRYFELTADRDTLRELLPDVEGIIRWYVRGTRFNIRVDPADGLVTQGVPDTPLTWMDAKVGDWVVTPRRGKAVEINALWYNALKLVEGWVREEHGAAGAGEYADRAAKCRAAFDRRFWYADGNYLYDVVDGDHGDDPALRPNQLFAIALPHPVLAENRWRPVLDAVTAKLLTPAGLRSLSPDHPDFQPRYDGDRRSRDASYHQGTVWPWLIGPYLDAWLKVHPDRRAEARQFVAGLVRDVGHSAAGTVCEICDAVEPYNPRGCVSQAFSVAEVLRGWVNTAGAG